MPLKNALCMKPRATPKVASDDVDKTFKKDSLEAAEKFDFLTAKCVLDTAKMQRLS